MDSPESECLLVDTGRLALLDARLWWRLWLNYDKIMMTCLGLVGLAFQPRNMHGNHASWLNLVGPNGKVWGLLVAESLIQAGMQVMHKPPAWQDQNHSHSLWLMYWIVLVSMWLYCMGPMWLFERVWGRKAHLTAKFPRWFRNASSRCRQILWTSSSKQSGKPSSRESTIEWHVSICSS